MVPVRLTCSVWGYDACHYSCKMFLCFYTQWLGEPHISHALMFVTFIKSVALWEASSQKMQWFFTRCIYFILFVFTLFTVDLKLLIYTQKKSLYSLYSNNIELIDVNSVTEQEMQSFPNQFLKSMWTSWQTHTHICTHIHQIIKAPLQGTPPFLCTFLCSEFSGVHCMNPT